MKLLLLFLLIPFQIFAPVITEQWKKENFEYHRIKSENRRIYKEVIEDLKKNEGLRLKPYYCPSNHLTIGYGHLIKRGESFTAITKKEAETLLKRDFEKRLNLISDTLTYNKRLAIAHFVFNVGIGNYKRSTLYKQIQANKPIDKEIIKWCHYRKGNRFIKSKWMLNSRKFELSLFNYNYDKNK